MDKLHAICVAFVATTCVGLSPSLRAQSTEDLFDMPLEELERIIVTAQKRKQRLQDVPISIVAIGRDKIANAAIHNLKEFSAYVPGVTINEAAIDTNLFIRGIGSGVNLGFERSVGTYVDGVYNGRGQLARAPFLDIERVEVLKGPQGILFGKNTIAGALNITTAEPTEDFEGFVEAYGDPEHGDAAISATVSGPVSPTLSGRLAASIRQVDGYYEHFRTGDDVVEADNRVVRAKLRWQASEALRASLKAEHMSFDNDGRARIVSYAGPGSALGFLVSEDQPVGGFRPPAIDRDHTDSDAISLTLDYALDNHSLTAISAYLDYDTEMTIDALASPFFATPGDDALFVRDAEERFEQVSQEIRLLSPETGKLAYLAGLYVQRSDLEMNSIIAFPFGGGVVRRTRQEGSSFSVFAQAIWHIDERLRLSFGARYNRESKDFTRQQLSTVPVPATVIGTIDPFQLDRSESRVTGGFSAQYEFSENFMGYASLSTGFKGGGYDEAVLRALAPGETLEQLFEFEDETVQSLEIGGKLSFAEGKAEINLAVFRSSYDDLQTSVFDGVASFSVSNAASSITQGVEIDLRWRASPWLLINGSLAYLDAYYDEFANGACSQWHAANTSSCMGPARDLSGEPLVFAPDVSAHLDIEYTFPLRGRLTAWANLDLFYTDDFYTASDLDPFTRQDAYTRIDLRLALAERSGKWELALIGKNLTDEVVSGWANDFTLSTTPGRENTYFALLDPPRTIALQGRMRF